MAGLRAAIIIAVFAALIISVNGERDHRLHARHAHDHEQPKPCTNNPAQHPHDPPCNPSTTKSTTKSDIDESSEEQTQPSTTSTNDTMTTSEPTVLERAHWCRSSNGTYISLGSTFMKNICTMCQCTTSRAIRCQQLECLPAYCIDNTMPYRKDGQCCAQCGYEVARNSCEYNGVTFPHGVVMKSVQAKMQCWCQLGNIECRTYIGSLLDNSLDLLTDEKVIYTILMILAVVLIFGSLVCVSCTFFFYYYYKRYQHTFQQAYDQYLNSAGWQPMNEEEEGTEGEFVGNEKQYETEQAYHESAFGQDMVPPPYAAHDDSHGYKEKDQKI